MDATADTKSNSEHAPRHHAQSHHAPSHHAPSLGRVEDDALVRGLGRYIADAPAANQAFAYFVRSPHAFARIVSIDTDAHAPGQLEWLYYGCDRAAECEASPDSIVNGEQVNIATASPAAGGKQ